MIRSTDRIRTTHVGSLARPRALLDLMKAAAEGRPVDPAELAETEGTAVADVVARQRAAGLDMISDGEQTKTGFYAYIGQRLSGFEPRPGRDPLEGFRAEIDSFPEYYEQYFTRAMPALVRPALVRTATWLQALAGTLAATHQTTGGRRCQVHRRSISS
jgi:5-methyltetrahydropteroyltriglutamate--homocysteine methyltransferase